MNQVLTAVNFDPKVGIIVLIALSALRVEVIGPLIWENEGIPNTDVRKAQRELLVRWRSRSGSESEFIDSRGFDDDAFVVRGKLGKLLGTRDIFAEGARAK